MFTYYPRPQKNFLSTMEVLLHSFSFLCFKVSGVCTIRELSRYFQMNCVAVTTCRDDSWHFVGSDRPWLKAPLTLASPAGTGRGGEGCLHGAAMCSLAVTLRLEARVLHSLIRPHQFNFWTGNRLLGHSSLFKVSSAPYMSTTEHSQYS